MKEGLIRITNEKNIFYDSIEKVYRYRQHCPNCSTIIDYCMCYSNLDLLYSDIDNGISEHTYSAKCALLAGDWDELPDAIEDMGYEKGKPIKDLTEEEARKILEKLTFDFDGDYPHGDACNS